MSSRRLRSAVLLASIALALTGCFVPAEPADPTPTPLFATEEEAFAAAEATYRAYVDALNQVDLSDPETFEAVFAWTAGEANANERGNLSQMHADAWVVTGSTEVTSVDGVTYDGLNVDAQACVDLSSVDVVDASGASMVSPERPPVSAIELSLVGADTPTGLAISAINAVDGAECP